MEENILKIFKKNDEVFKIDKDMFGGKKEFDKEKFNKEELVLFVVFFVNMLNDELKNEMENNDS